jgi:hypothetical protein
MKPSPVILKAIDEMRAVLHKYQLSGHLVVTDGEACEFELCTDESVCFTIDREKGTLRFLSIRGDRSEEEQEAEQEHSLRVIFSLRDVFINQACTFTSLGEMLEQKLNVKMESIWRAGEAEKPTTH